MVWNLAVHVSVLVYTYKQFGLLNPFSYSRVRSTPKASSIILQPKALMLNCNKINVQSNTITSVPFDAMQCSHIYCYCLYSYEYSLYNVYCDKVMTSTACKTNLLIPLYRAQARDREMRVWTISVREGR